MGGTGQVTLGFVRRDDGTWHAVSQLPSSQLELYTWASMEVSDFEQPRLAFSQGGLSYLFEHDVANLYVFRISPEPEPFP